MEEKYRKFCKFDKNTGNIVFGAHEDKDANGSSYISIAYFNHQTLEYSPPVQVSTSLFNKEISLRKVFCEKNN